MLWNKGLMLSYLALLINFSTVTLVLHGYSNTIVQITLLVIKQIETFLEGHHPVTRSL